MKFYFCIQPIKSKKTKQSIMLKRAMAKTKTTLFNLFAFVSGLRLVPLTQILDGDEDEDVLYADMINNRGRR